MPSSKTQIPDHVFTPPADLTTQARTLIHQTSEWLSANSLRIVIALVVGAAIVAVLLGVKTLAMRLARNHSAIGWRTVLCRIAARTSFWFLLIVAARLVDGYAETPPLLDKTIYFLFTVALTFQAAVWARELVLGFVEYRAGETDQDHSALASALGIIRFLVTFTLFALALVLVLGNLGVNVTGLIAGLGVGGIAIGLAAQGIFKDLFAALAILFDKPFRKGDSIKWNNISGTIERIGLKTTHIRAITGEQVIVGNAYLIDKEMFNLARLDRRRMILSIALPFDTPDTAAEQVPDMLREIVSSVPKCAVVRAGLTGITSAGLQYELQFDVKSAIYNEVFDARTKVCVGILRRFHGAGLAFATPDGKAQPLPAPMSGPETPRVPHMAEANGENGTRNETAP